MTKIDCHLTFDRKIKTLKKKMFLFLLFSICLSANERRIHRKDGKRVLKPIGIRDSDDFQQDDDPLDFSLRRDRERHQRHHDRAQKERRYRYQPKEPNFDGNQQFDENQNIYNSQYQNTIQLPNGTYLCKSGYHSGKIVTEKGCWKCPLCGPQEICTYPGKCEIPIPLIVDIKQMDKKSNIRVMYEVDSLQFKPEYAYCMVNNKIHKAPYVTDHMVPCSPPESGNIISVMISFDKVKWSNPILNPLSPVNEMNTKSFFVVLGSILVILIILVLIYFASKRRRNYKYPVYREARQIVQFPQNENQEVVYASSKQLY